MLFTSISRNGSPCTMRKHKDPWTSSWRNTLYSNNVARFIHGDPRLVELPMRNNMGLNWWNKLRKGWNSEYLKPTPEMYGHVINVHLLKPFWVLKKLVFGGYIPPVSHSYGWKMLKNYGNWTMETNLGIPNKAYPESSFARITLFERSSYQTNLCHTTKQKSDHCFFRTTTNPWFVRHTVGKPSVLDVFDACQTCFEVGVSQSQQGRVPCLNSCAPT